MSRRQYPIAGPEIPKVDRQTRTKKQPPPAVPQKHKFSFAIFFYVWAKLLQWDVPKIHLEIIQFLDDHANWSNNTAVLQVFRGAGKSTILGLFIAYLLAIDPTLRFLILSADHNTAVKITRDVTNIISKHPLAQHLRGTENTWREDSFYVSGATDMRNPSVFAVGIQSNVTGGRADWVIFDDVEVAKNAANERLREALRMRIGDTVHIIVPGGKRLFVGTPHSFESIYPEQIDPEHGGVGASPMRIPLINNPTGDFPFIEGDSAWPERFPLEEIQKRQRDSRTKGNFLSQYQLIPYNIEDNLFDVMQLIEYRSEIDFYAANRETVLTIGKTRMVSCSCFWDPAVGRAARDDSVIGVVYSSAEGHYYLHRFEELTGEPDEQCEQVKQFCLQYHVPHVIVESNGVGAFLPALLRKHLAGTGIASEGKATNKNKAEKIMEAYEVPLASGYIHVHSSVLQGKFMPQLRDFSPILCGRTKDDYIDCGAAAMLNEPIRITKGIGFGGPPDKVKWASGGESIEVGLEGFSYG